MNPLPNIWIGAIPTFDATIEQIELCLNVLKDNAETADFTDPAIKKRYIDDVSYMKQFFERAELLARNEL